MSLPKILTAIVLFLASVGYPFNGKSQGEYFMEKTIVLAGRVAGFDEGSFPAGIQLIYNSFCCQDQIIETAFLDKDGMFEFRFENNIAQDYMLLYGADLHRLVLIPGDSVNLEVRRGEPAEPGNVPVGMTKEYELISDNSFTRRSIWLIEELKERTSAENQKYQELIGRTKDIDSIKNIIHEMESFVESHFGSIVIENQFQDSALLEWAGQDIKYRYRNDFIVELLKRMMKSSREEKELLIARNPYAPGENNEGEKVIYSTTYQRFIHHLEILYLMVRSEKSRQLYQEGNHDELARFRIDFIRNHFDGFQAEMLLCRYFEGSLNSPLKSDYLRTQIENFIRETPNENFSRVLGEKFSLIFDGFDHAENMKQGELMDIPENIDDVLPEIIKENEGKVIVLTFWATWCGPCLDELKSRFPEFVKKFSGEDVAFVFLAFRSPENLWKKIINGVDFEGKHYLLNQSQKLTMDGIFKISAIPHHAVIDRDGKVVMNMPSEVGEELERVVVSSL